MFGAQRGCELIAHEPPGQSLACVQFVPVVVLPIAGLVVQPVVLEADARDAAGVAHHGRITGRGRVAARRRVAMPRTSDALALIGAADATTARVALVDHAVAVVVDEVADL